jgi:beta-lactamase class A
MRNFIALFFSLLALLPQAEAAAPGAAFTSKIAALESQNGGRLGVAVISTSGAPLFSYRANQRFAMCSTFKALLGALVLARVDAQQDSLDRSISYTSADILDYAPITEKELAAGHMTVSALTAASIQYSDNTAANLLLDTVGGPAALTRYLRSIGDQTTRLDRNEPTLNSNTADDERDTSTPQAMAATLQKLLVGDHLSPASKEQLKAWMFGNTTGDARLRAGFDKFWMVGDKTGSGANGASNDVAIVFPRGLAPFIITVFYTGSAASGEAKNAVIAEVAKLAADTLVAGRKRLGQAQQH